MIHQKIRQEKTKIQKNKLSNAVATKKYLSEVEIENLFPPTCLTKTIIHTTNLGKLAFIYITNVSDCLSRERRERGAPSLIKETTSSMTMSVIDRREESIKEKCKKRARTRYVLLFRNFVERILKKLCIDKFALREKGKLLEERRQ